MEQIRQVLLAHSGADAYVIFFLIVTGCGMGLPMNSDLCLITASVLAAMGYLRIGLLLPLAFLALLSGDSVVFFVGRKWGKRVLHVRPFRWVLSARKVDQAESYLRTRGTKFLFLVRFLPLIRTVLFFAAGTFRVAPSRFYLLNASATLLYLPLLMGSAYYASENIDTIVSVLKRFQFGLLFALVVLASGVAVRKRLAEGKARASGT